MEPNVRKQACTSVGFTVISFHGQIGPSHIVPLINQIVPQFWYKTRCEARLFSLWLKERGIHRKPIDWLENSSFGNIA